MTAGETIKALRKAKGYTLEELGNKCGVGKSTVRKWEEGLIKNMGRDKIALLSVALDVSPDYIIGLDEIEEPREEESAGLSEDELEMMELYRAANQQGRNAAKAVLRAALTEEAVSSLSVS